MGVPPDHLRERHQLLAYLVVAGFTNRQIAAKLSLTESRVSVIQKSPLFVALVDQLRDELKGRTIGSVIDRLMAEAGSTLDTLISLRDSGTKDDGVRLGAANSLADRIPDLRRISKVEEERTIRVLLDGGTLALMTQAQREVDRVVDAEIVAVVPVAPGDGRIPVKTIEEAVAAYAEREA